MELSIKKLIESGNIPAKKEVLFEDEFSEKNYSFMLSGDFIEFNSHCEMMPSFQYEPYNDESYTGYIENYPKIFIVYDKKIADALKNNIPVGEKYEKLDNKYFAFRTEISYYEEILYCYVFREGTAREYELFGLSYSLDVADTPLEKKLTAILDKAVESYKEN